MRGIWALILKRESGLLVVWLGCCGMDKGEVDRMIMLAKNMVGERSNWEFAQRHSIMCTLVLHLKVTHEVMWCTNALLQHKEARIKRDW